MKIIYSDSCNMPGGEEKWHKFYTRKKAESLHNENDKAVHPDLSHHLLSLYRNMSLVLYGLLGVNRCGLITVLLLVKEDSSDF
jgi:hypothetical protein